MLDDPDLYQIVDALFRITIIITPQTDFAAIACSTLAGTSLGPGPMRSRWPGLMSLKSFGSIFDASALMIDRLPP